MTSIAKKENLSIGLLWLFHVSGLLGILLGFEEWFYSMTPLNLLLTFFLFAWNHARFSLKHFALFGFLALLGMIIEWLGVHRGWFFGNYSYGENLGVRVDGIPVLIGIYWAVLSFAAHSIGRRLFGKGKIGTSKTLLFGAGLMTGLDLFLEQLAPVMDLWSFIPEAPLQNYISWFVFAFLFQLIIHQFYRKETEPALPFGSLRFSVHLYAVQFFFFGMLMLIT